MSFRVAMKALEILFLPKNLEESFANGNWKKCLNVFY